MADSLTNPKGQTKINPLQKKNAISTSNKQPYVVYKIGKRPFVIKDINIRDKAVLDS